MKIKLTEAQLKLVLKEVGGYDSPEVMATHAGPLHSVINGNTMELLMLVSKLASAVRDEELNKSELTNGIYNLNQKISEYIKQMPDYVSEIYVDDDFKTILKSFISALVKINKYFRMLVGSGYNDDESFYTGLSFDMSQDDLELKVAEQISTLTDKIYELGEMIVSINQRFNDRTSSMNENTMNEQNEQREYRFKGDPDPVTGEPKVLYDMDVMGTMEDKNGDLFDIVRYYFYIKDYNYPDDHRKRNNMGPYDETQPKPPNAIRAIFDNRKRKLMQRLEIKGEKFKPNKINGWFPSEKMTPQQEDKLDKHIESGDWKKNKVKEKGWSFDGQTHRRQTEKSMTLEVTYIVPHGFEFHVGYLYR